MASNLPVYLSFGIARHFISGTDTSFMKLYILAEGLRAEIASYESDSSHGIQKFSSVKNKRQMKRHS